MELCLKRSIIEGVFMEFVQQNKQTFLREGVCERAFINDIKQEPFYA